MEPDEKLTKAERKALRKEERIQFEEQHMQQQQRNRYIKMFGIIIIVLGIFVYWKSTRLDIPVNEQQKPVNEILTTDWQLGNPQGLVKIVEYSDFECPACKVYAGFGEQITKSLGNYVGFAYRQFPLREIHQNSQIAAQAAEAAGKQGKFWEMGDKLFSNQEKWGESTKAQDFFITYAQELGLNVPKFQQDIKSKEVRVLVEADYLSGLVNKIDATPTFFINGQRMNNLKGPDDLLARIELMLQEATQSGTAK